MTGCARPSSTGTRCNVRPKAVRSRSSRECVCSPARPAGQRRGAARAIAHRPLRRPVSLKLAHETTAIFTVDGRRRLVRYLLGHPDAETARLRDISVDLRPIRDEVRDGLSRLARAREAIAADDAVLSGVDGCVKARKRGYPESTHVTWLELRAREDWALVRRAVANGYVLVTNDRADFTPLVEREHRHPGLVCITVAHGLMSLDVQTRLFEHALARLGGQDLAGRVLEIALGAASRYYAPYCTSLFCRADSVICFRRESRRDGGVFGGASGISYKNRGVSL